MSQPSTPSVRDLFIDSVLNLAPASDNSWASTLREQGRGQAQDTGGFIINLHRHDTQSRDARESQSLPEVIPEPERLQRRATRGTEGNTSGRRRGARSRP